MAPDLERYSRQILFPPLGEEGQRRLLAARVALIGCGALGSGLADLLVRAGVGFLRVIDRDFVELNNLQRQTLFTEADVADGRPKAVAAARRLAEINSRVTVEPHVVDLHAANVEPLVEDVELILDGTDNFETRYLLNDVAVKRRIPWIYGACVGAAGICLPILPDGPPCLRCIWDRPPPPGISPTCDTAGVLGPVVQIVVALQAAEALKLLAGRAEDVCKKLTHVDIWSNRFDRLEMTPPAGVNPCPCCGERRFDYLSARRMEGAAALCGRDAVQISPPSDGVRVDLDRVAEQVRPLADGPPQLNEWLLRFTIDRFRVTLFRDGRAIIQGTNRLDQARSLYARYIGA